MSDQGYMLARLSNPRKTIRVHRIVAESFLPNPDCLPFVNHKDCVRHNNNVDNLEWCTQWQNLKHSENLGRMQRNYWKGKRSPNAKLTEEQVQEIIKDYALGNQSLEFMGKRFGVSKRTIGRIIHGETYAKLQWLEEN